MAERPLQRASRFWTAKLRSRWSALAHLGRLTWLTVALRSSLPCADEMPVCAASRHRFRQYVEKLAVAELLARATTEGASFLPKVNAMMDAAKSTVMKMA